LLKKQEEMVHINLNYRRKNKIMIEIIEASSQELPLIRQLAEQTFYATYLPLQPKEKVVYLFDFMYSLSSLAIR
jgi:hypothetical protein